MGAQTQKKWGPRRQVLGGENLFLCKQGQIPHSNQRKRGRPTHHFSTSFSSFFRNSSCITSHYKLLQPFQDGKKASTTLQQWATTLAAVQQQPLKVFDKEGPVPDDSSLLPTQASSQSSRKRWTNQPDQPCSTTSSKKVPDIVLLVLLCREMSAVPNSVWVLLLADTGLAPGHHTTCRPLSKHTFSTIREPQLVFIRFVVTSSSCLRCQL